MIVETLSVHSSRQEVQEWTLNSLVFRTIIPPCSLSPQSITLSSLIFTKKTALHVQTTKMEGEPTAKNVQKGARFKIQRESEARMLIRLYGESPVAQVVRASD